MTRTLSHIVLLTFILCSPNLKGQHIKLYNFTYEDGLLSDDLGHAMQDSKGFLWLCSYDGLMRWDGKDSKTYVHNRNDFNTLSSNICYLTFEDSEHRIWIGTINGLCLYERSNDRIVRLDITNGKGGIPVNAIEEDEDGKLWLGTSGGLCHFDPETNLSTWDFGLRSESIGTDQSIFDMEMDKSKKLWFVTYNAGLINYDPRTKIVRQFKHNEDDPHSLSRNELESIYIDPSGDIWVGTIDGRISRFDANGILKKNYVLKFDGTGKKLAGGIMCVYRDKKGRVWAGAKNSVMFLLNNEADEFYPFVQHAINKSHRLCKSIWSITEDNFGNLWFVSLGNGLFASNEHKNMFAHVYGQKINEVPTNSFNVTGFDEAANGNIWLSMSGGGVSEYSPISHQLKNYTSKDWLINDVVMDVKLDDQGRIWAACWNSGVMSYDPSTGKTQYLFNIENKLSLGHDNVKSLLPIDTLLWIGTHGSGVSLYDMKHDRFVDQEELSQGLNLFDPTWINHMYQDSKGRIWISNYGGVHVFENGQLIRYQEEEGEKTLGTNAINMVAEDLGGNIWIASDDGIYRFDESGGFVMVSGLGLPQAIKSIACDHDNKLWLGTNSGLYVINEERNEVVDFKISDGLQGMSFIQKSALSSKNGTVYFGGKNGFNHMHPDSIYTAVVGGQFYFNELRILGQLQVPGDSGSYLSKVLSLTDTIQLNYDQEFFTISYGVVNLYSQDHLNYAYKLIGLSDEWVELGKVQNINFNHLPAGTYQLQMKYSLHDGSWRVVDKKLTIVVVPPWWDELWFKWLLVLVILSLITAYVWSRWRRIKRQNQALEGVIEERTGELSEAVDELSAQNESLELLNNSHINQTSRLLQEQARLHRTQKDLEKIIRTGKVVEGEITKVLAELQEPVAMEDHILDLTILAGVKAQYVDELTNLLTGRAEIFIHSPTEDFELALNRLQPNMIIVDKENLSVIESIRSIASFSHLPILLVLMKRESFDEALNQYHGVDAIIYRSELSDHLIKTIESLKGRQVLLNSLLGEEGNISGVDQNLLIRINTYIHENLSDANLDANRLCSEVGVSRTVLYSKIKSITGLSVHEYIKSIRLKASIELLKRGEMKINQIAYEVGFNSASYYIRSFSKQYGSSPREYIQG